LAVSHKYNSNSLAAVLHINKSNAAGNSKRLYTPALKPIENLLELSSDNFDIIRCVHPVRKYLNC